MPKKRLPPAAALDQKAGIPWLKVALAAVVVVVVGALIVWQVGEQKRAARVQALLDQADSARHSSPSEASVLLRRARGIAPDDVRVLYALGEVMLELDELTEATDLLDRARVLGAEPKVHLLLGQAFRRRYEATGDLSAYRRARTEFTDAEKVAELKPEALFHRGMLELCEHNRDGRAALEYLQRVVDEYPDFKEAENARELIALLQPVLERSGV